MRIEQGTSSVVDFAVRTTAGSVGVDEITGKSVAASSSVMLSAEALSRLQQETHDSGSPTTSEAKQGTLATQVNRLALLQPQALPDLGSPLYNDPYTADDATALNSLLFMTDGNSQKTLDDFSTAMHQVLRDGVVGLNRYDSSDTAEAMSLSLTEAKLYKLVEKYIPADRQQQASGYVDALIGSKIAFREAVHLQLAQGTLETAQQHGTAAYIADAQRYLDELHQGNARPQKELNIMRDATQHADNMDNAFQTFTTVINATPHADQAQESIKAALAQLEVYRNQWQAFTQSLS
ncbi:hypothetical protein EM595_p0501 (plasmid) [Duffyella gerundensis]|uniref:Uncharacterized protein n=1 Tax=Duffyella gerundensis TaxID=1619313 RepID=A0A0U5LAR6_9GAMM|nr:hypothetical protein [Duffyella gerundensis]CUU26197.1 hypothetical protein EM595_p0501 [Duffyella gerundensis]